MAELARIARPRPWLFSPLRTSAIIPSPYLGLGYSRSISATAACRSGGAYSYARQNSRGTQSKGRTREQDQQRATEVMSSFLLPYTVVRPPLWRFPRNPITFTKMVWLLAKNRATSLGAQLGVYFVSMEKPSGGYRWPIFRPRKRAAIPTAKALHVQMSEAVAAGDKETLRHICTPGLFQTLAGAIDARPPHVRNEWELVRYVNRMYYPRLADFRITYQNGPNAKLVKQAVVSIASVQRLTRYDDAKWGAEGKPAAARERHMVEHIVLQAEVHDKTFVTESWKVWGTLPEMSYEDIVEHEALLREAMAGSRPRR
ncbi:hypothetical protein GGR55DRAFT_656976 [Xylaria sp. FL0064]|nr:hypothetical protein GGR55DRAFT_656976 [Xylaria sp. FL0064]